MRDEVLEIIAEKDGDYERLYVETFKDGIRISDEGCGEDHPSSIFMSHDQFKKLTAASKPDAETVVKALEGCLAECKEILNFTGGCEHDVGVCCCQLIRRIDHAEKALAQWRGGKI